MSNLPFSLRRFGSKSGSMELGYTTFTVNPPLKNIPRPPINHGISSTRLLIRYAPTPESPPSSEARG
jgi:hypothetical protein